MIFDGLGLDLYEPSEAVSVMVFEGVKETTPVIGIAINTGRSSLVFLDIDEYTNVLTSLTDAYTRAVARIENKKMKVGKG